MRLLSTIIFTLFSGFATAQNIIPINTGRTTDTGKTSGNFWVPYTVKFSQYASSDTNKVLGIGSNGRLILRTKGNGSGLPDTAAAIRTALRDTAAAIRSSTPIPTLTSVLTAGNTANNYMRLGNATNYIDLDSFGLAIRQGIFSPVILANDIGNGFGILGLGLTTTGYGVAQRPSTSLTNSQLIIWGDKSGTPLLDADTTIIISTKGNVRKVTDSIGLLRVKYTDTATVISTKGNVRKVTDSIGLLRVKYTDTATVISTKGNVRKVTDSIGLLRVKYTDTVAMISTKDNVRKLADSIRATVVTSIATTAPITGGTITTTGTIGLGTVGYANGGTGKTTTWSKGRMTWYGTNGFNQADSFFFDSTNKYLGLGTIVPTAKLHIYETGISANRTNIISEFAGTTSGAICDVMLMRNPAGQTIGIGMKDNSATFEAQRNGITLMTMNDLGAVLGTFSPSLSMTNGLTINTAMSNTSGMSRGLNVVLTGANTGLGGVDGIYCNVSASSTGSGQQNLMRLQKNTFDKFRVDTSGYIIAPFMPQSAATDSILTTSSTGVISKMSPTRLGAGGLNVVRTTTDADYTITGFGQFIKTTTPTANRLLILPTGITGGIIVVVNLNTSGIFQWSFSGGTVKDLAGNTITAITNGTSYRMFFDGLNFQLY